MKKLLLFLGLCIVLSSFVSADILSHGISGIGDNSQTRYQGFKIKLTVGKILTNFTMSPTDDTEFSNCKMEDDDLICYSKLDLDSYCINDECYGHRKKELTKVLS